MIPFIDLAAQQARIRPALDAAIARVLAHGGYVMGPEVAAFETQLAAAGGAAGVRPFQSLVISLKDGFYDKADALVGVYRDAQAGGSRTLTLDLAAYA